MNRREALVTLGLTTLSGVAWSNILPSTTSRLLQAAMAPASAPATVTPAGQAAADRAIDDRLREDMEHLSSRVNSEEGIQMILACENLVPDKRTHRVPAPALMPLNAALAAAMHRDAPAFLRLRPEAKFKDVSRLIEVLTYRDFHDAKQDQL